MKRVTAALLVALAIGFAGGWWIRGTSGPVQPERRASERHGEPASEPRLQIADVQLPDGEDPLAEPADDKNATEAQADDDVAADIRASDFAETLGLVRARSSFSNGEVSALLIKAQEAQAQRNKRIFLELADVLARSKHPDAIAWLVQVMRGEAGEYPHDLDEILLKRLRSDEEIDLTGLARYLVGPDGLQAGRHTYGSWVSYLAQRGTDEDRADLLARGPDEGLYALWTALMLRDRSRTLEVYARGIADERMANRRHYMLGLLARSRAPGALGVVEGHVREVDEGRPPPYGMDQDRLLRLYVDALDSKTLAQAATFLEGLRSDQIRLDALGHLHVLYQRGHRLEAFEGLAGLPARTIRSLLPKQNELTEEQRRLFLQATMQTIYEYPPLFTEENISALEEAGAQWEGDEAKAIENKATHYRRKLDRRPYWR